VVGRTSIVDGKHVWLGPFPAWSGVDDCHDCDIRGIFVGGDADHVGVAALVGLAG
jgi:hypothetical protein